MNNPHKYVHKRQRNHCSDEGSYKARHLDIENSTSVHVCCHKHRHSPSPNHTCNYIKSGLPRRFMFYNHSEWIDFPKPVVQTLVEGFRERRSSKEIVMAGQRLLVDFMSMMMVNLISRKQCSVAWIDEADKCYFPTQFVEDIVVDLSDAGSENVGSTAGRNESEKENKSQTEVKVSPQKSSDPDVLNTMFENLERESENFRFVQKLFLSGMRPFMSEKDVVSIHRYSPKDMAALYRLEVFEEEILSVQSAFRGSSVKYGWFGSDRFKITEILLRGFSEAAKPTGGELVIGAHLVPENRAFTGVNLCAADEKGLQYMLLCRVILGNSEEVLPGSKEFFPSSNEYDAGVDDLLNHNCYVVWPSHIGSYIHPEYVLCFKLVQSIRDYLDELKDVRFHVPTTKAVRDFNKFCNAMDKAVGATNSTWMPFSVLFSEIQDSISSIAKELLFHHYEELKARKITRQDMLKKMRVIVGPQVLLSVLKRLKLRNKTNPDGLVKVEEATDIEKPAARIISGEQEGVQLFRGDGSRS